MRHAFTWNMLIAYAIIATSVFSYGFDDAVYSTIQTMDCTYCNPPISFFAHKFSVDFSKLSKSNSALMIAPLGSMDSAPSIWPSSILLACLQKQLAHSSDGQLENIMDVEPVL